MFQEILSPLSQFEITDLIQMRILSSFRLSLTNIGFYLTLGAIFILILSLLSTNYNKLVSDK
jgi:F-type H+-transporting ATPase subunit a